MAATWQRTRRLEIERYYEALTLCSASSIVEPSGLTADPGVVVLASWRPDEHGNPMAVVLVVVLVALGLGNLALTYFGIDGDARKSKHVHVAIVMTAVLTIGGPLVQYWVNAHGDRVVVSAVTGGESFAYVAPQDHDASETIPLVVWNHGDNPLTGVTVMAWSQKFGVDEPPFEPEIQVGTLGPRDMRWIPTRIAPKIDEKAGFGHLILNISAQNGTVQELINFRPAKDGRRWATRFTVTKECPVDGKPNTFTNCMLLDRSVWSDGTVDAPTVAQQATR